MRHSQSPLFRRPRVASPLAGRPHWGRPVVVSRLEQFANNPQSTLVNDILPDDSRFDLVDPANFSPIGFFRVIIDGEIIGVGARDGASCSALVRGAESTTRAVHLAGATVTQILTAGGLVQGMRDLTNLTNTYRNTAQIVTPSVGIPLDNTIPQSNEGTEIWTLPFTPRFSTSTLVVDVQLSGTITPATWIVAALFRNSETDAIEGNAVYVETATAHRPLRVRWSGPLTTGLSPIVFRLRVGYGIGAAAGPVTIGNLLGGTMTMSATIQEIPVP